MDREVHIRSYFSIDTDLAKEMKEWAEFVSGEGYSVELSSCDAPATVSVQFVQEEEGGYVRVAGEGDGKLFDRVLGRVIYALSGASDDLLVERVR